MKDSHAGERREPAEHLIASDRKTKLIRATIHAVRSAVDKLRCLVARTSQQIALAGLDRSQASHLGNPKVHDLDFRACALRTRRSLTHHDVPGLDITMHNIQLMRRVEPSSGLRQDLKRFR
jgi:hypothetical protein